jgi:hypothetical protein
MPEPISILTDSGERAMTFADLQYISILTEHGDRPMELEDLRHMSILTDDGERPIDLTDIEAGASEALAMDEDPFARFFPRSPRPNAELFAGLTEGLLADEASSNQPPMSEAPATQPVPADNGELIHDATSQPTTRPANPSIPIPALPAGAGLHDVAIRNIQYAIDLLKADQTYSQKGAALQHLLDTNSIQLTNLGYAHGGFVMGFTPRPYFSAANTIQIDVAFAAQADPHNIIGIATLAGTLVHELAHLESYTGHGTIGNLFSKVGEGIALEMPEWFDKDGDFRSLGERYYSNLGIEVRNAIVLDLQRSRNHH